MILINNKKILLLVNFKFDYFDYIQFNLFTVSLLNEGL